MRIEDRHRQIVEQVRGAGRVLVTELAEHFDVTPETIRRDLTALDRNGALRKVHGGAIPPPPRPAAGVAHRGSGRAACWGRGWGSRLISGVGG